MQSLKRLSPIPDLSGAWCNTSLWVSSTMEAVSFVTPSLERFFIRTVAEVMAAADGGGKAVAGALRPQVQAFVREESRHSIAHQRFNRALLGYLGEAPPALALIDRLLSAARRRLSVAARLRLVEALEHTAEWLSTRYLQREPAWVFQCAYARRLFAQHAREEIGHRAVIHALQPGASGPGPAAKAAVFGLVWLAIVLAGGTYLLLSVPWILRRKRRLGAARTRIHSQEPQEKP